MILSKRMKKNSSAENISGYSQETLRSNLEEKFEPQMSWNNYGEDGKWCIDHVKSIFSFPLEAPAAKINALSNLRPMWWRDNLKRGKRSDAPVEI